MQSPAFVASTPPMATTGTSTARAMAASPSNPVGGSASSLDGVAQTGPAPMYAAPRAAAPRGLLDRRGRQAEDQPTPERPLGACIAAPEMDAVGAELESGIHVVVHDERRAEAGQTAPDLDDANRGRLLQAQLDDRRAVVHRAQPRLGVLHERMHAHG